MEASRAPSKPLLWGQLCRSLWAPGFVKAVLPDSGFADTNNYQQGGSGFHGLWGPPWAFKEEEELRNPQTLWRKPSLRDQKTLARVQTCAFTENPLRCARHAREESMDVWKRELDMRERGVWTRGNGNLTAALQDHSPVEENRYTCHFQTLNTFSFSFERNTRCLTSVRQYVNNQLKADQSFNTRSLHSLC